jgi:hypothetical protein
MTFSYLWTLLICMCGTIDPVTYIRWALGFGIKIGYEIGHARLSGNSIILCGADFNKRLQKQIWLSKCHCALRIRLQQQGKVESHFAFEERERAKCLVSLLEAFHPRRWWWGGSCLPSSWLLHLLVPPLPCERSSLSPPSLPWESSSLSPPPPWPLVESARRPHAHRCPPAGEVPLLRAVRPPWPLVESARRHGRPRTHRCRLSARSPRSEPCSDHPFGDAFCECNTLLEMANLE